MTDAETLQKWQLESAAKLKRLEAEIQAERAFFEGLRQKLAVMGAAPAEGNGRPDSATLNATLREAIKQQKTLPFLIRRVFEARGGQLTAAEVAKILKAAGEESDGLVTAITSTLWRLKDKRYRLVRRGVYELIPKEEDEKP